MKNYARVIVKSVNGDSTDDFLTFLTDKAGAVQILQHAATKEEQRTDDSLLGLQIRVEYFTAAEQPEDFEAAGEELEGSLDINW